MKTFTVLQPKIELVLQYYTYIENEVCKNAKKKTKS